MLGMCRPRGSLSSGASTPQKGRGGRPALSLTHTKRGNVRAYEHRRDSLETGCPARPPLGQGRPGETWGGERGEGRAESRGDVFVSGEMSGSYQNGGTMKCGGSVLKACQHIWRCT